MWKIRNKIKFDKIQVTNRFLLEHTMQKYELRLTSLKKLVLLLNITAKLDCGNCLIKYYT